MNGSNVEQYDEPGEIVSVSCDAEVIAVVRPWVSPEVSLGVGDGPIVFGHRLSDRLPGTKIGERPMHEKNGLSGAVLNVGEANPIHLYLLGQGRYDPKTGSWIGSSAHGGMDFQL